MKMCVIASLVLAILCACNYVNAVTQQVWNLQRDNLSEYRTILFKFKIRSETECLMIAGEPVGNVTLHAAVFDAAAGNCTLLQCRLGNGGCRKCRNANNQSMPLIWVRSLGSRSNCWTTFQHRVDASVNFTRNWADYAAGFGQGEDRNYWMGLDKLSLISGNDSCGVGGVRCRVRWEFSDWNDTWYWAENAGFTVASASDKYRLTMGALDTARSSVGQVPLSHIWSPYDRQFSTPDSDNDLSTASCAQIYTAGWWFNSCAAMNPNGVYKMPPFSSLGEPVRYFYTDSPYPLSENYGMKTFEMMMLAGY